MSGRACCRTRLVILSGPGALLGAALLTAFRICWSVICGSYGIGGGHVVEDCLMSERSADGGGGRMIFETRRFFADMLSSGP